MPDKDKETSEAIITEENIIGQELKLGDRLAVNRTILAADRTMLAGVRTSMSFIGFGFTIFNILKYIQEHGSERLMRQHTPRNIASLMLAAGIIPLFALMTQYSRTLKRMGTKESIFSNPNFQMAGVIFLLGIVLLITVIGNTLLL